MKPKLFSTLKNYTFKDFYSDLMAGLIVAIVALPLSIAFGIASGVSPQQGLITAIVAAFIISLLGGSRVQIGGPTGAFIVIVYNIVMQYGVAGLATATILAGIIMIVMGLMKFGSWTKFIPMPLVVAFTAGIAVVLFSTQIGDIFGLKIAEKIPGEFIAKWAVYFKYMNSINFYALAITVLTVLMIVYLPKLTKAIPAPFVALLVVSAAVKFFNIPVETIRDRFGQISFGIPELSMPSLDFATVQSLLMPAITIALLGAVESLLSAIVADGMINDRHDSNMELVAQGVANIITPMLGGIPATGAIARTATNIRSGGKTPVAGILNAVFLFLITLFFSPLISYIPMAGLAGILVVVAYNMSGWREFLRLLKAPRNDVIVLLTTFFFTVIFDLTIAIEVGIILSSFLFMGKMCDSSYVRAVDSKTKSKDGKKSIIDNVDLPSNVVIYEPHGAFFFAATSKFELVLRDMCEAYDYIVFRMKHIYTIDASALKMLEDFLKYVNARKTKILFLQTSDEVKMAMKKFGIFKKINETKDFATIEELLEYIKKDNK